MTIGKLQILLLKIKSTVSLLFSAHEVLSSVSYKVNLLAGIFSDNLDNGVISAPTFCPRSKLKLHNIPVTSKMCKVITALDSFN